MMTRSARNAKRQTRLQFESLQPASSSSAQNLYSDAVRDRLANVRYSGAKLRQRTPEKDGPSILPTPEPSSAVRVRTSSPLTSPPSSPTLPSRQTPLHAETHLHDQADEEEDEILLPSSKRRKLAVGIATTTLSSSPRRSARLTASSPTRISRRARVDTNLHNPWSDIGSPETSDHEAYTISTKPLRTQFNKANTADDDGFMVEDDHVSLASSVDDTALKKPTPRPSKKKADDFLVDDDVVEYITSDSESAPTRHQRSFKRQSQKRSAARSRREKQELEDDLLDLQDSDDSDGGQRSRTRGGPVTTQRDEARTHLERLKQKRARKGSKRMIISDEDEDEDEHEEGSGEAVDIEYISQIPRYIDESDSEESLIGAPEPQPETFDNDEGNEFDDFVVEDTENATGRHNRPHPDIPLQFTSFASAKPKELFIHIIEWLVKNKISPAFSRDDDLYDLSFNRVDDQVKAQAGSRLISSAWSSTFKHAILARPTMTVEALPGLDEDHIRTCDACNRTNHPARYDFKFTGTPYDKSTLEPLDEQEDEDENLEDETRSRKSNKSYDSQGHELACASTHFYLGRYCAASAEMGHKLTHWKHHLNSEVLSYLSEQGVLSAEQIVRRDKQSHKKREKEAENIVDAMSETGVISELWRQFQADLDDARWGMEGHEVRGKGRGKQRIGSVRINSDGRIGEWMEGGRYKEILRVDSDSDA